MRIEQIWKFEPNPSVDFWTYLPKNKDTRELFINNKWKLMHLHQTRMLQLYTVNWILRITILLTYRYDE